VSENRNAEPSQGSGAQKNTKLNQSLSLYVRELNHVCKEGHDTTNDHVARLAAALIARAPVELARLLEVQA
jgi:hypothetical protein